MVKDKLVPKLRFSGFDGEWNKTILNEVSDVRDGTHDSPKYYDKGCPLITSKNLMKNGTISFKEVNLISKEDFNAINKRSNVDSGDILFGMIGTIGNPVIVGENSNFAIKNVALIKEQNELKNSFLIHYLNSPIIKKQFHRINDGGTQKFIALGKIRNLIINAPSINEQNKLSDFLSILDEKIGLLEKRYEKYIEFKKYLMQQIFAQKLRFDDNCQYETKKVKDFLIESKIEGIDDINKRLTVKLNLKGITVRESKTIEIEGATKQFIRKSGQFIYGKQNLHKGAFGIVPKELDGYLTSSDIPSFDFKGEIEPKWFYYYFSRKSFYEKLESLSTGTGSKRISPKDFLNIKIIVPEIKEQQRIVCLFAKIDKKIEQNANQISQMNNFKKSLLQQMFV